MENHPEEKRQSWLNSPSFVKRSFAIWGYSVCATLMIYAGFLAVAVVIGIVVGIVNYFNNF